MKLSKKMLKKLKTRVISATAVLAVMVLIFACSNLNISVNSIISSISGKEENQEVGQNSIEVIKDSTGINLTINGANESGVNKIEVYQGIDKIKEYAYSDGKKDKQENVKITIPFGETHQISVMVNGETVAQKSVENMRYIYNANDLVTFRNLVNSGNSFEGKYVELMNNIDLSTVCSSTLGVSWIPIGVTTVNFAGHFNGNYCSINNLYINSNAYETAGLFGNLPSTSVVENLFLRNMYIYNYWTSSNTTVAAGISGYLYGKITNVGIYDGQIKAYNNKVYAFAGGIAAYAIGTNSVISNCFNRAYIEGTMSTSLDSSVRCGGMVGITGDGALIENCYNTGNIYTSGSRVTFVGGVIGAHMSSNSIARNLYNAGSVTMKTNGHVGGVAGSVGMSGGGGGQIYNVYCLNNVTYTYKINSSASYYQGNRVSSDTLKTYASNLNIHAFTTDIYGINEGYPILRWQVPTIEFDKRQIYTNVGEQVQLNLNTSKFIAANAIGTITYTSDNTDIATVDNNGKITAVGEGYTTIYATESTYNLKAMMIINVAKYGAVTFAQSTSGGLDTTAKYTIVLKEDGTVWRSWR